MTAPEPLVTAAELGPGAGSPTPGPSTAGRALSGATWVSASRLAVQMVQFAVGLVLARLLTPADFGLLASVYVITGFAVIFFEMGLGAALVQAEDPTEEDLSTVFWVNVLSGAGFAALMWALGPVVASVFGQPKLIGLTPLVALAFTFSAGAVHEALLQRQLRFAAVAVVDLVAACLGLGTTIVCALAGLGAVSLAIGPIVTCASWTVGVMIAVRWRPRHFVSVASLKRLWGFSSGLLGARTVQYASSTVDSLVLGRYVGPAALGYYNRAFNLMLLPVNQVAGALGSVMFPVLSTMRNDTARMRSAYVRALRVLSLVVFPAFVGLSLVAPALVPVLWGAGWEPTVLLLQLLGLAGLPQCLMLSVTWVYQAQGRTRALLKLTAVNTSLVIAAVCIGLQWGPTGVATGVLVASWLALPVGIRWGLATIQLGVGSVVASLGPVVVSTLVMAGAVSLPLVLPGVDSTSGLVLVSQVVGGAVVYVLAVLAVGRSVLKELREVVAQRSRS